METEKKIGEEEKRNDQHRQNDAYAICMQTMFTLNVRKS